MYRETPIFWTRLPPKRYISLDLFADLKRNHSNKYRLQISISPASVVLTHN